MRSVCASGAKMISRSTLAFPALGMTAADRGHDLFGRDAARRVRLHGVVDWNDIFAQPALDRGVTLLQRTQASADHLARRGVGARRHERVDVACLLDGQAERAFLGSRHWSDYPQLIVHSMIISYSP